MSIAARVESWIARHGLPEAGSTVVVGCSGGADSTALLLALAAWGRSPLHIIYVDHGLRKGTEREAAFVASLAARVGAAFEAVRVEVRRRGNRMAAAREARYAALAGVAERVGARCVAVGHTATDQAETVQFRIERGDVRHALAGMPAIRALGGPFDGPRGAGSLRLIRPLLDVRRDEIEHWMALLGVVPVEDPTNARDEYTRVRIRRGLQARPGSEAVLTSTAEAMAARVADYDRRAFALGPLDALSAERVAEAGADVALRLLRRAGVRGAGWRHAGALLDLASSTHGTRSIGFGGGVWVERRYDRLRFGRGDVPAVADESIAVTGEGRYWLLGRAIDVLVQATPLPDQANGPARDALDVAVLSSPLVLRNIRRGDRLRLRGGRRKLQDVLVDRKVPRPLRRRLMVLAPASSALDAEDPCDVLWLEGVGCAADVRAAEGAPARVVLRVDDPLLVGHDGAGSEASTATGGRSAAPPRGRLTSP